MRLQASRTASVSHRAIAALAAFALLWSACSLSPLSHRINVGQEPFVVFVGEGIDHHTDLFAVQAGGGPVSQVTFTPLVERHPRLTPTGEVVAFLRMRDTLPATRREVVLMNLSTGAETVVALPPDAGQPHTLGWNADASALYVGSDRGIWRGTVPPAPVHVVPVGAADSATADSALDLWLGRPRFARVVRCSGGGLCVIGPRKDTTALAPRGVDGFRWGDDSVAWIEAGTVIVRSLGPGVARRLAWKGAPMHPREASYARGATPAR